MAVEITLSDPQSRVFSDPARFKVVAAGRRFGKALSLDTPILTTFGFRRMSELSVNDYVFGSDGRPTKITYVSPVHLNHKIYKLTFSDGSVVKADANHEWVMNRGTPGITGDISAQKHTTQELFDLGVEEDFSVSIAKPILGLSEKLRGLRDLNSVSGLYTRYVLNIEEIETEPVQCIEVDAPDHLYLCGESLIPTHNTVLSIYLMLYEASTPKSKVYYVTSSYRAAKSIAWDALKDALWSSGWVEKINEADLSIRLVNKSVITLRGGDSPDSLRGVGLSAVVIDEAAYCDERLWREVLRPALSDTGGSCTFISSPSGRDWFYDLWKKGEEKEPGWASWQFSTIEGGNVPDDEIEAAKRELDARTFEQEYEAKFTTYWGVIYYNFDAQESIKKKEYVKGKGVLVGIDFNIDPMSCVICQKHGDTLYVIDEIVIFSSNTDEMADEIRARYPVEDTIIYPDPAAVQRRTSAGGKTDISILQNYGFRVRHRSTHPFVKDRINAVNSRLMTGDGMRHLFIDPKCKRLQEALEKQTYKEGTSVPDKSRGFDHLCFAGGQLVETERGIQKISKIDPSGMVRTYNGKWVEYIHARQTGFSSTLILDLESGGTIECTPDHRILTIHGFAEAKDLRVGEMLSKTNENYKPPKPSEREVREDLDDLLEDLPAFVKESMCGDRVLRIRKSEAVVPVYCLYVPRWHMFEIVTGTRYDKKAGKYVPTVAHVSNCDSLGYLCEYLFPVKRHSSGVSKMRLAGL